MINHKGFVYMRTLRPKTPLLYDQQQTFNIGGSKMLRFSSSDELTVVGTGITVFEALKAADDLKKENINIRVVDCYSINPIDADTLKNCLQETKKKVVITVEDHFEHGGMGDFASAAISGMEGQVIKMAVTKISESGTKDELLKDAGINADKIVEKVKSLVRVIEPVA
jgi:transketolase